MRHHKYPSILPAGRRWEQVSSLVLLPVALIILSGRGAIGQEPEVSKVPPLARYLPRQGLQAYLEFEGLDAHSSAWRKSAAYKLLNDTSLGALLQDMAGQALDLAQQSVPPGKQVASGDYLNLLKQAARDGLALGVFKAGPEHTHAAVVVRKGDRPETIRLLETLATPAPASPNRSRNRAANTGEPVHASAMPMLWWVEHGDLILTDNDAFETIVGVIDGKQPSAADHPLRGFDPAEGRLRAVGLRVRRPCGLTSCARGRGEAGSGRSQASRASVGFSG